MVKFTVHAHAGKLSLAELGLLAAQLAGAVGACAALHAWLG